jgi:hypothetical protein
MGVFKEMHEGRHFETAREYTELRRILSRAISNGYVEQVSVTKPIVSSRGEEWYRDKETNEIYCLVAPGEQSRGWWARIDPGDFSQASDRVQ